MPKQLNVNLAFTADTSQARQQLQQLQKQLSELTSGKSLGSSNGSFVITKELQSAVDTASKLKVTLKEATNASTGKLDLTKFQESMNKSQMSIGKYKDALLALGPSGQQAFANLASSITQAEIPMRRTNALLAEMGTTIKNAARWQISSSLIHGFMGAIQGAYGYAQDLNRSLTDIAIVTGNSVDNMAAFAEQANKSAQALSTSTLAYTDAALIYYQQGLNDEAVRERTETTLKLSNVTRQSAEDVSSYMTAIWNNFYDGSQSLESFADKITALGAATASSSAEIAKGLQQFAALGSSLGLNYDDATAALATVVAQTRQSASTVGNSFRTLFQRIESLKLGDTLEDGVDLTKYSAALEKVGVQILDVNGEMRDMHAVIEDLGAVWQDLSKAQQNALAQTVGGVRNSNTLIAWMDNFDEFQKNLGIAQNAEGALQEQADIYAQSWEAAQKRVKAAWQAIYQDLIDENFFIGIANSVEKLLSLVDNFIDAAGGLKGVLLGLTTVVVSLFQDSLVKGLDNALFNLKMFTKAGQESYAALKQKANQELVDAFSDSDTSADRIGKAYAQQGILNNAYLENVEKMTDFERQIAQMKMDQQKTMIENIRLQAEQNAQLEQEANLLETSLSKRIRAKADSTDKQDAIVNLGDLGNKAKASGAMTTAISQLNNIKVDNTNLESAKNNIIAIINELDKNEVIDQFDDSTRQAVESIKKLAESGNFTQDQLKGLIDNLNNMSLAGDDTYLVADKLKENLEHLGFSSSEASNMVEKLVESYTKAGAGAQQLGAQESTLKQFTDEVAASFNATQQKVMTFSEGIVAIAGHISSIMMAITSLKSALDAINNPDLTGWEKFRQVTMSLSIAIPMLIKSFAGMKADILGNASAMLASEIATRKNTAALMELGLARAYANGEITTENALEAAGVIWKERQAIAAMEDSAAHLTLAGAIKTTTAALWENIAAMGAWLMAHPAILAIGLALGAVAVAIKAIHDASPETELEAANDRLRDASEAAKEVSEAYDELKSTLDEYRQVQEDINNIENSDERKRAISEENEKILEMLHNTENWHDLIGDLKYDDNGLISLTEEQLKALENDKAREESLARQLRLQEQINVNTAEQKVEDSKYTGKRINVTSAGTPNLRPDDINYVAPQGKDVTSAVADLLAEKGLGLNSDTEVIKNVLEEAGFDIAQVMPDLEAIRGDAESSRQFNEMIASHTQTMAENDALEKQQNQLNIDQAQSEMGDKLSISELSRFDDVQARIAEEWNLLSEETKEAVRNNIMTLQEAFGDRLNIEKANNEALQREKEEHDKWREQNVNSIADKVFFSTYGKDKNGNYTDNTADKINEFSDEDLKIAATLELDKYKSIEELKAAIEEVKAQTEQDRRFELEMQTAQQAGLDMDEWNRYVEYLQKTNEELANNKVLAAEVATANMRLNRGVKSLVDDFDDWQKIIKTANEEGNEWSKNNIDYAESVQGIQKALADIGNVDVSVIESFGDKFIADNLDLIQEAAYGDVDAIDELIKKIAELNLMQIAVNLDTEEAKAEMQDLIDAIYDINFNEIEIGTHMNAEQLSGVYGALSDLVSQGILTADSINSALASIGFSPIVDYMDIPITDEHVSYDSATGTYTAKDDEGNTYTLSADAVVSNSASEQGMLHIPIIKGSNIGGSFGTIATGGSTGTLASAIGSSNFTGGTGKFTSPTNRNKGAASRPKSTGGKGGKGKGGGSGSDKKKEEKELKELERVKEEEDRYHNLNEAVDDLNTTLDRLDKNKDRAWGKSKINFMNLEIKKTKEQIALTKQYIAEIQRYAKIDKEALEQVLSSIGMSASEIANQFDADGVLKDYEALFKRIQDSFNNTALQTYNNAIEAFNNATIAYNNSAQSDADKEAYENAEKTLKEAEKIYKTQEETYKEQMDALKQYEDTINLLQDKEQELIDQLNDLYDKQLELVKEKVDIHVSLNEDDLKLLEWHLKHLGDSLDHVADRIVNLNKQMDANADDIYRWQKGLEDIFANHGVNIDLSQYDNGADLLAALEKGTNDLTGIFTKEEIDTIRDYRDKLMEAYDAMRDLTDQVTENVIKAYEDWNDKLDEQIEKFEKYKDLIAIWKDIVELTGKNRLGMSDEDILDFQQKIVDNAQNAAEAAKNIADAHREEVERLRQILANEDLTEYERAEYEKMLKVEEEYLEAAEKQALEKFKEALQEAEELFNQTLEANANAYKKMMSGGLGSLDLLQEQFNRQKKLNHLYLDNYEKYKKLGDITAQINKNLNDSSNIKIQEKLNTLLDEVNLKMTESFQISEGEAEILARRVALLQAEMQLEDARNAKSAVRMTRDNEGNFSYTYTADQDAISEAQQNYADKFYDLLDYERKLQEDMQDQMIQTMAEFVERRNDIWNDTLLTDAERDAALQRLEEDYTKMMNFYADQLGMTMDEMMRLRDDDWLDYEDILNRKLASQDDFITEFENTLLGTVVPGWEEIKDVMESWQTSSQDLYDKDNAAFKHWQEENSQTWELAGYDVNKGAAQVQAALDGIEKESGEATEATIKMAEEMNKAMDGIIDKAGVFYQTWANYMENAVKKIDKMSTALNELLRLLGEVDDANSGSNDKPSTSSSSSSTPAPTPAPASSSSGSKGKLTIGTTATYTGGLYYTTSYGGGTGNRGPGKKVKVTYMNPGAPYPIHVESTDSAYGWLREDQLTGYDTGGFTGKWGKDGRLAVLHEKELVLNKEDTSNILSVVDMVRQITSTLGAQGNYLSNSISNFSNVLNGEYGQQQLQQQVHIDASFPNVQSHSEIELALNNLINSASQYVNRK